MPASISSRQRHLITSHDLLSSATVMPVRTSVDVQMLSWSGAAGLLGSLSIRVCVSAHWRSDQSINQTTPVDPLHTNNSPLNPFPLPGRVDARDELVELLRIQHAPRAQGGVAADAALRVELRLPVPAEPDGARLWGFVGVCGGVN